MLHKQIFWLSALGPLFIFLAGLFMSAITVGSFWVLYDTFFIGWFVAFLVSLLFWRSAYFNCGLPQKVSALIIPLFGAIIPILGCNYVYLASYGDPLGCPWVMAEMGFPWAQYRMGKAELGISVRQQMLNRYKNSFGVLVHLVQVSNPDVTSGTNDPEAVRHRARAVEWLRRAVESGCIPALPELSRALGFGMGVEAFGDSEKKWKFFEAEANRGYSYAQEMLAEGYEKGEGGLGQNRTRAGLLYKRAAEQGAYESMKKLVEMYMNGSNGVEKDVKEAAKWQTRSQQRWREIAGSVEDLRLQNCSQAYWR